MELCKWKSRPILFAFWLDVLLDLSNEIYIIPLHLTMVMNQHVIFEKQDFRFVPMDDPMRSKAVSQNFALICLPEVTLFDLLFESVGVTLGSACRTEHLLSSTKDVDI